MPLPILHSFAGYSLYRLAEPKKRKRSWLIVIVCVFIANLADLDFIPGFFVGQGTLFHRSFSHSIGAALFVGLSFAFISVVMARVSFGRIFLLCTGVYFSHALLDFLSGPGAEIPILWPFVSTPMSTPFALYAQTDPSIHSVATVRDLFLWFLMPQTMHVIFYEMAIVFSICALSALFEDSKLGIRPAQSVVPVRFAQAVIFFTGFIITRV